MDRRPNHIITRPEILSLLKRVCENRSLLTIKINEQAETYSSTILAIDTRKNLLLVDDLFPPPMHDLERNTNLHCFTRLNGICINFSCQIKGHSTDNGSLLYQLALPNKIHYHQRRRHYRVPLTWTAANLTGQTDDMPFSATLFDISSSGIGAKLEAHSDLALEPNLLLPECSITIPNFKTMTTALKVRSLRTYSAENSFCFGAEFTHLDHNQIKQLQQLVSLLDRESCQIRSLAVEIAKQGSFG